MASPPQQACRWRAIVAGNARSAPRRTRELRMSNVIKFERPPEEKPPKPKREISPATRKVLIWAAVVAAFVLAWGYFTLFGGNSSPV